MHQLVRLGQFMTAAAPPNPNTAPKQQHKHNDGKFHRDDRKRRAEEGAARLDRGHDGIAQASGCHGRTGARHHGCRLHRAGRATAGDHAEQPLQPRIHASNERSRNNRPGHDRRRAGDGVEQVVNPRNVIATDFEKSRHEKN